MVHYRSSDSLFCVSWFALLGFWPKRHCHTELILTQWLRNKHFLLCKRISYHDKTFTLWLPYSNTVYLTSVQTTSGFLNFYLSVWSSQSWNFGSILDIMILYEGFVPRCSIMDEIQILKSYYNHIPAPNPWKRTLFNKAKPTLFIGTNAQSHPPTLFFYYFG